MKKYPGMRKLYFQNRWSKEQAQREADGLRRSYSAIDLNLNIGKSPAFILYCDELAQKLTGINQLRDRIFEIDRQLPRAFSLKFFDRCFVEEIRQTNETEGIHSTRKEIREFMEQIESGKRANRFDGMIRKYQMLIHKDDFSLETCQDVRRLYDEFILDEVQREEPRNVPDGQCFRSGTVGVQNTHGEMIHAGLYPESAIMDTMTRALAFLNDDNYDPLIRLAAYHFLFAYIHPFYDGNGRMARFISSAKLKEYGLHPLVVFRLSYTIKERRSEYYSLFRETEDWRNFGDLTAFVVAFLDFVLKSSEEILSYLRDQYERLAHYKEIIHNINISDAAKNVLDVLTQVSICDGESLSRKELSGISDISIYLLKGILSELEAYIAVSARGRGEAYRADLEKLDQCEQP